MDSYNKFLAESVLTEDKVITYRLLSRTLRVHVNTAKQMLYEFHRSQNAKRPGAVHATYLVYGTKHAADGGSKPQNGADDDVEMTSSAPEVNSLAELVPAFTLSLIPEERLKEALAEYEEVSSIHVYSVGPNPTKDLAMLADVANEVLMLGAGGDERTLTTMTNPRVRRRERHGAGLKAATASTAAVKPEGKPALAKTLQASAPTKVKEDAKPVQPAPEASEKATSAPAKKAAPLPKRGASSGIMQAFSKASTKAKATAKPAAKTSQPATPSGNDNSSMQALSDDGEDDEEMPQPKPRGASGSKSRKQREEELRQMMEEDDEEEEASERDDMSQEEPMEEEPAAPEPVQEETEVVTASTNGRRRGKRRVMRKKQIMDDQGYLVTIQEPGWESFSEDEAPPPAKAAKTTSSAPPAPVAKPKQAGQKGSQGSIMSFFSKK